MEAAEGSATTEARGESKLQWWMLGGFALGLGLGLLVHFFAGGASWVETVTTYVTGPIGQLFLRLLFMLVIPLLFSALVVGIAEMGEIKSLRRVGLRTLMLTIVVSSIAVLISIGIVNLLQPGAGTDPAMVQSMLDDAGSNASAILERTGSTPTGIDAVLSIVPSNVVSAMTANDILAVMFFALFFGIGILLAGDRREVQVLKDGIEGIFVVAMKLIGIVIKMAPLAVFCFMFNLAALFGWELMVRLSAYVGVVLLALGAQMFLVFPLLLILIAKKNPLDFFRQTQEATVMAFSTASSNATLPTALRVADLELKLPRKVARFVLTVGATANQNGTAMFEGVTVLFLAQFFGVDLSFTQQVTVMLICILGGIGTAGVPAGSLPVVALILGMVGVPPEGIGLVLGVDRFLDMCRTTLNVVGDLVLATVVSTGEKDAPEGAPA
ncbi:dicarboxylate/amino acid:cation symporter [Sphingosinithalassobacter portus]|uniref:dicarboxylate/amino acid:cation symporter n=1 Tax=Stakelama portus TaxID=2676234 RepID=UPI001EFDF186|nr:dicarboxylate/amino acid:cation symporter [Sphingosinithalassobacter portus]